MEMSSLKTDVKKSNYSLDVGYTWIYWYYSDIRGFEFSLWSIVKLIPKFAFQNTFAHQRFWCGNVLSVVLRIFAQKKLKKSTQLLKKQTGNIKYKLTDKDMMECFAFNK